MEVYLNMSSSTNITLQAPENISEPWKYKIKYSMTSKAWNSNSLTAKITRNSGLGIAFLSIVETITEIIKIPLKFIGNQFGLYKNSFFQSKSKKISQIDTKSTEEEINEKKLEKTFAWKKALVIGVSILGICLLGLGSYEAYVRFNSTQKEQKNLTALSKIYSHEIYPNPQCDEKTFINEILNYLFIK